MISTVAHQELRHAVEVTAMEKEALFPLLGRLAPWGLRLLKSPVAQGVSRTLGTRPASRAGLSFRKRMMVAAGLPVRAGAKRIPLSKKRLLMSAGFPALMAALPGEGTPAQRFGEGLLMSAGFLGPAVALRGWRGGVAGLAGAWMAPAIPRKLFGANPPPPNVPIRPSGVYPFRQGTYAVN